MNILTFARANDPEITWLALECLLLCAERPSTVAELVEMTGQRNGHVNRAVRSLTVWWDASKQEVAQPRLHLLQRRRRPKPNRGHRIHLTKAGAIFLYQAGCRDAPGS